MVCLDRHEPVSIAGALRAKKETTGEEAAVVSRGPMEKGFGGLEKEVGLYSVEPGQ